ncbi:MAG: HEPN domain-containing protein [Caulobacteraceae bacterium]|nr:HEPN domain-containing protein [Caulobacteraceae bacterium]
MRTDLDHLPEAKRVELARIVEILFSEFEDALACGSKPHKKQGRILKIILFGSYARGDWVDDPVGGYVSDYDLLVVVNYEQLTDLEYWAKADEHLLRELAITQRLSAPANFIVHSLQDVNQRLSQGRYFFSDIVREGVALYEAPAHPFARVEPLPPVTELADATEYFQYWHRSAGRYLQTGVEHTSRGWSNEAAFELHQATERLYHCVLLVLTLYSPKSHKLNFLRSQAEQLDGRLAAAWPRGTRFERRCFELLRKAYVEARYSPNYEITAEELAWLGARVSHLQTLVAEVCEARLAELRQKIA